MDINIQGDMDGIEAADKIRENHDIPIIFLTAFADDGFIQRAKASAPYGYLLKPFKERELQATIEMAVNKHQLEKDLKESEEKFQKMSDATKDALILANEFGRISFWNPGAVEIFGYSVDEAIGQPLHELIVPSTYLNDFEEGFSAFQQTGEGPLIGETAEMIAKGKNNRSFPVEISIDAVQIKDQWHSIGIIRDISERKLAEEMQKDNDNEYRELLEQFQLVLDAVPGKLILFNNEHAVLWTNHEFDEAFPDYAKEDDTHCHQLFHQTDQLETCAQCPISKAIHTATTTNGEITMPDGMQHQVKAVPIFDEYSNVKQVLAICNQE